MVDDCIGHRIHRESHGWLSINVRRIVRKRNISNTRSQHDKRQRLQSRNPKRKRTTAAKVPLTGAMQSAVSVLQAVMDSRIAVRLAIVVAGMLLADDRRTASAGSSRRECEMIGIASTIA